MWSRKLYLKIVGSVLLITLCSLLGSWLLITGTSYFFSFVCLLFILLITGLIIRLTNETNRRISTFFGSLHNNDTAQLYPREAADEFLNKLHEEMNHITSLFRKNRHEVEEKKRYYESILRVLTHEIRNSITPITSLSADLLKHSGTDSPEEVREGLIVIHSQAQSLSSFLDSYHRLTHLPDPDRQPIQIASLFTKLEHLLCAEPGSRNVHYRAPEPMLLQADPHLLTLSLINLIRNALQSIGQQPAGKVVVEAFPSADHPRITITDNGPGIPPERLSAIFTPFFSTKPGGSGIGLSISQRIMQLHNGTLTVTSIPSVRTVFTMEF